MLEATLSETPDYLQWQAEWRELSIVGRQLSFQDEDLNALSPSQVFGQLRSDECLVAVCRVARQPVKLILVPNQVVYVYLRKRCNTQVVPSRILVWMDRLRLKITKQPLVRRWLTATIPAECSIRSYVAIPRSEIHRFPCALSEERSNW